MNEGVNEWGTLNLNPEPEPRNPEPGTRNRVS